MAVQFSITRAMTTEEGIYGLILVSGVIASTGGTGLPAWKTLLLTLITVVVFWLAHVFAGAVALHGSLSTNGTPVGVTTAVRKSARKARGMLAATVFPAIALLLGTIGLVKESDSKWLALWVAVGVLGALGYIAYLRRGARMLARLIGALTTASFGVAIVLVKVYLTH